MLNAECFSRMLIADRSLLLCRSLKISHPGKRTLPHGAEEDKLGHEPHKAIYRFFNIAPLAGRNVSRHAAMIAHGKPGQQGAASRHDLISRAQERALLKEALGIEPHRGKIARIGREQAEEAEDMPGAGSLLDIGIDQPTPQSDLTLIGDMQADHARERRGLLALGNFSPLPAGVTELHQPAEQRRLWRGFGEG